MVELSGRYYDGKRTLSSPARLRRTYDGLILETDNLPPRPVSVAKVVQLATTLSITFKEGGKIELPPRYAIATTWSGTAAQKQKMAA